MFTFSDQQIAALLMRDMHYSFFDFLAEMSTDCNYSAKIAKIPVRVSLKKTSLIIVNLYKNDLI